MRTASVGLIGHIRSISSDVLRAVQTRIALFAVELQQEKAWLIRQIVMGAAALFLGIFGLFLAILWIFFSLPEDKRVTALGVAAIFFILAAAATAAKLTIDSHKRGHLAATLRVLKDDIRALGGHHD